MIVRDRCVSGSFVMLGGMGMSYSPPFTDRVQPDGCNFLDFRASSTAHIIGHGTRRHFKTIPDLTELRPSTTSCSSTKSLKWDRQYNHMFCILSNTDGISWVADLKSTTLQQLTSTSCNHFCRKRGMSFHGWYLRHWPHPCDNGASQVNDGLKRFWLFLSVMYFS